jgi:predicted dehydrogenase
MSRLRVGLVGCGFIGQRHLRNLCGFPDARVVAVADPAPERAARAAAMAGARPYASHVDLLDGHELDALFVCVPPFAHGGPELDALERGLPLFVEKPLSADLAVSDRVMAAVSRAAVPTAVGYQWRYLDTLELAQAIMSERPPRLALGRWFTSTPRAPWWHVRALSGGQLVEQATHLFDVVRLLMGDVVRMFSAGSRIPRPAFPDADVEDVSTVALQFASGAVATISATCLLHWHDRIGLELLGEGVALELTEESLTIRRSGGADVHAAGVDPFIREERDFLDAVRGRPNRIRVPYEEALATHRLVVAAARGARDDDAAFDAPAA